MRKQKKIKNKFKKIKIMQVMDLYAQKMSVTYLKQDNSA